METIEVEGGVVLTLDEARDVVAWWDRKALRLPGCVSIGVDRCAYLGAKTHLAPAIVEQLRDFVEPWTEVDDLEALARKHGKRIRWRTSMQSAWVHGVVTDAVIRGSGAKVAATDDDGIVWELREDVQVRRPRKPTLVLGDVIGGSVVESEDGARVRVYDGGPDAATRFVSDLESPYVLAAWSRDTPVTLAEEGQ